MAARTSLSGATATPTSSWVTKRRSSITYCSSGFAIATVSFLPFLLIDLVVSTTLLSMGMLQLPPAMISLPFKVLLFVMIDGWNLLVGSIVRSFA